MSPENEGGMMYMSRRAIEALEAQSYADGRRDATEDMRLDVEDIFDQYKRLRQVLGVEDDHSLLDACSQLKDQLARLEKSVGSLEREIQYMKENP